MRGRLSAILSALFLIVAVSLTPLRSFGQEPREEKKATERKKGQKIWTNDDFPSTPAAQAEEAKKAEESTPVVDPFAESGRAREERKLLQEDLQAFHKALEELRDRRSLAAENYDREMLDLAIETAEGNIFNFEERLKELDARIAHLEKQTRGRKRPAPKSTTQPSTQPTTPQ